MVATTSCHKEVLEILTGKVENTGSRLFLFGKDFYIQKKMSLELKGWFLDIKGINNIYRNLALPLLGQYQPLNLSLAIALAELYLGIREKKVNEEESKEELIYYPGKREI